MEGTVKRFGAEVKQDELLTSRREKGRTQVSARQPSRCKWYWGGGIFWPQLPFAHYCEQIALGPRVEGGAAQ